MKNKILIAVVLLISNAYIKGCCCARGPFTVNNQTGSTLYVASSSILCCLSPNYEAVAPSKSTTIYKPFVYAIHLRTSVGGTLNLNHSTTDISRDYSPKSEADTLDVTVNYDNQMPTNSTLKVVAKSKGQTTLDQTNT